MGLPTFAKVWLVVSSLVVILDATFVFMRPRSLIGGDLEAFFPGYDIYQKVDRSYTDMNNHFVVAISVMNYAEALLAFLAVAKGSHVLSMVVSSMTLCKTAVFFIAEAASGFHSVAHNDLATVVGVYVLPSSLWIFFPIFCIVSAARALTGSSKKAKSS